MSEYADLGLQESNDSVLFLHVLYYSGYSGELLSLFQMESMSSTAGGILEKVNE